MTLDLNGKTLTRDAGIAITVNTTGNLTHKDTAEGGKITSGTKMRTVNVLGALTLESGTVEHTGTGMGNCAVLLSGNASFTMNGGVVTGNKYGVYCQNTNAAVTINSGTVNGTVASIDSAQNSNTFTITDGKVAVSGGTFDTPVPEAYCAEGYIPEDNGDNTYGVKRGAYVAQVEEAKFETFAEAVAAADNGAKTITLLADIEDAYTLAADETLKVAKSGKTLTVSAPENYILSEETAEDVTTYTAAAAAAKINSDLYPTFAAAAAARTSNDDVITLLKDIEDSYTMSENETLKVKKDGKSLTVAAPATCTLTETTDEEDGVTTYVTSKDDYTAEFGSQYPMTVNSVTNVPVKLYKNGALLKKSADYQAQYDSGRWAVSISPADGAELSGTPTIASSGITYKIKGLKAGTVTVTLTDTLNPSYAISRDYEVTHKVTLTWDSSNRLVENGAREITALKVDTLEANLEDYTFTTANTDIATISGTTVTPIKAGTVNITVTGKNDPAVTATAVIIFKNAAALYDGTYYDTLAHALEAAGTDESENPTVTVVNNITESAYYSKADKEITVDLNGKTVTGSASTSYTLRVSRGVITVTDSSEAGTGTVMHGKDYAFIVDHVANAAQRSKLVLESGTFVGKTSVAQAGMFGGTGSNKKYYGGDLEVTGGTFITENDTGDTPDANGNHRFTLNILSPSTTPVFTESSITVKGGTFKQFDPAANAAEGEHTNFVAEGYVSVVEEKDGVNWYTVKLAEAYVTGHTISLKDQIGVNFYLFVPDGYTISGISYEWGDIYSADGTWTAVTPKEENGYANYKTSVMVSARCMTDEIAMTVSFAEEGSSDLTDNFSIKDYAGTAAAIYADNALLKKLLCDMLDYGAAAQNYFHYKNTGDDADLASDYIPTVDSTWTAETAPYTLEDVTTIGDLDASLFGLEYVGATFTATSQTKIRLESADADKVLRSDTDGNGLDIADATAIQRYLAEYDDSPVGQTVITPDPTKPTDPTVAETTDPDELPFVPSKR